MITLYRPGDSLLHRMPAGAKLLAVLAITITIAVTATNAWALIAAAVLTICGYLVGGLGVRCLLAQIVTVRWLIAVMLITQLVFLPIPTAVMNTSRVVVVVVLAALFTLTTRISDLLDTTERVLGPLRRFGVDPAKIGLLLSLTMTTVPVLAELAATIRDAQRARGLPPRITTVAVPLLVMSVKHADDISDALVARGIE